MEHADLLRHVAETFEKLGVRYLVTGSTATIVYGEPRFTNDLDVVVELPPVRVEGLLAAFPAGEYYVSRPAVETAIARKQQFNILHPASGLKVDVIIASDSNFDRVRLGRARLLPIFADRTVSFAAPEDVILKKLEYYRLGGSEKHLRDISGVLRVQGEQIDRAYIAKWAEQMGLTSEWALAITRAGAPDLPPSPT